MDQAEEPLRGDELIGESRQHSGRHPRIRFRPEDGPVDRINAFFDRYRGILLAVVPILITIMTSLGVRWIAASPPITALQAQDRKLSDKDSTLSASIELLRGDFSLHKQAELESRDKLNQGIQVLMAGQCFERSARELAYMQTIVTFSCSTARRATP
jgi:hypothetical protein